MLLLIDNYDSFSHNLARYLTRLGQQVHVVRNDLVSVEDVRTHLPDAIILSPGPCTPEQAGCSVDLVRYLGHQVPILGICLGHQAIVTAYGGQIVRTTPMHGRTSDIIHCQEGVLTDLPSPFAACRYHSLVAERATLPSQLRVSAETVDGLVMAVQHQSFPVVGLQFHPESILTQHGYLLLANFLKLAGLVAVTCDPPPDTELVRHPEAQPPMARKPITF